MDTPIPGCCMWVAWADPTSRRAKADIHASRSSERAIDHRRIAILIAIGNVRRRGRFRERLHVLAACTFGSAAPTRYESTPMATMSGHRGNERECRGDARRVGEVIPPQSPMRALAFPGLVAGGKDNGAGCTAVGLDRHALNAARALPRFARVPPVSRILSPRFLHVGLLGNLGGVLEAIAHAVHGVQPLRAARVVADLGAQVLHMRCRWCARSPRSRSPAPSPPAPCANTRGRGSGRAW